MITVFHQPLASEIPVGAGNAILFASEMTASGDRGLISQNCCQRGFGPETANTPRRPGGPFRSEYPF